MRIVNQGTVCSSAMDGPYKSLCFSALCVQKSGRWICSFRSGLKKNGRIGERILITWSDDEGAAWSKPISPFNTMFVNGKYGGFRYMGLTAVDEKVVLGSLCWTEHTYLDSRPLMNSRNEGAILENTMLVTLSEDGGETWSHPYAPGLNKVFKGQKAFSTGSLYLPSGEILWSYELCKGYEDRKPFEKKIVAAVSKDLGGTWDTQTVVIGDRNRYYWDQRWSVMNDGSILMLFWTYDVVNQKYINIHAVESRDDGRSWSAPWDTGVSVQPAKPVPLKDGRVAMVYVDRNGSPAIKVRISEDKGRTFSEKTEFIIADSGMENQTLSKSNYSDLLKEFTAYSIGLPCAELLGNGDILVSYYVGAKADVTDIKWSRISID